MHSSSHQSPPPAPTPARDSPGANNAPRIPAPIAQTAPLPNFLVRTCSCLVLCCRRLPKAPFLCRPNLFPRPLSCRSGKTVRMSRRPPWRFHFFPARLQPVQFFKPHQYRIKRPGRYASALAQRIPVLPLPRTAQ